MIYKEKPSDFNPKFELAGVICEYKGKILLLLRHPDKPYGNLWNLPAGTIEKNESPQEAAVRELGEEAGININLKDLGEKRTYIERYPEYDYYSHWFKANTASDSVTLKDDEAIEFKWVTPREALSLEMVPDEAYFIKDAYNL